MEDLKYTVYEYTDECANKSYEGARYYSSYDPEEPPKGQKIVGHFADGDEAQSVALADGGKGADVWISQQPKEYMTPEIEDFLKASILQTQVDLLKKRIGKIEDKDESRAK